MIVNGMGMEVTGTQVEVELEMVDPLVLGMEAPMVGMESVDPMALVDQGQGKMSPSSPSPPGAWARVLGGEVILAKPMEEEEEEVG